MGEETLIKTGAGHEAYFRDGVRFIGCTRCERASWQSNPTREEQLAWLDRQACPNKKLCRAPWLQGLFCTLLAGHGGPHCTGYETTRDLPSAETDFP